MWSQPLRRGLCKMSSRHVRLSHFSDAAASSQSQSGPLWETKRTLQQRAKVGPSSAAKGRRVNILGDILRAHRFVCKLEQLRSAKRNMVAQSRGRQRSHPPVHHSRASPAEIST